MGFSEKQIKISIEPFLRHTEAKNQFLEWVLNRKRLPVASYTACSRKSKVKIKTGNAGAQSKQLFHRKESTWRAKIEKCSYIRGGWLFRSEPESSRKLIQWCDSGGGNVLLNQNWPTQLLNMIIKEESLLNIEANWFLSISSFILKLSSCCKQFLGNWSAIASDMLTCG